MSVAGILRRRGKLEVDMTEGSIWKHLIRFAFPLLLGNLFQQLYNTVDTFVVGNFVSNAAYSAVGTVGPIINTLIGFFSGLATGAGVVISQFFGAGDRRSVSRAVHTSLVLTLIMGVLFTAVGIIASPTMLGFMKTPDSVMPEAITYLTIYFSGVIGLMIYNMGAGILRAVGDSTRPFIFLVVSAVINTVLDLIFVLAFDMGVAGVAYATVIAQGVSAILVVIALMRADSDIKVKITSLGLDFSILKKIVKIGIPAALQMAVTSFSNIFVQSYINYFGEDCMSGWTSYSKIDQFLLLPMTSISLASTTFVGQNLGRGRVERAKKGAATALIMSVSSVIILMIPVVAFAPELVGFFNPKAEVVEFGALFLRIISPFYVLCCFNQLYAGVLRGAGDATAPMIIMVGSYVLFRQAYLFVVANFISNTVIPIVMAYPAAWLVAATVTFIYYKRADLSKNAVTAKGESLEPETE